MGRTQIVLLFILMVNDDYALVCGEILAVMTGCVGHPHALTLGRYGLRGAHIGKDDMAIESLLVNVFGRSIKAGATR